MIGYKTSVLIQKPIQEMSNSELDVAVAQEVLGCKPEWSESYHEWCCTCPGGLHAIDSQCSMIADYCNGRYFRWVQNVAEAVESLRKFDVLDSALEICEGALGAVRQYGNIDEEK